MWRVCPKCKGMTKQMPCDRCELISISASPAGSPLMVDMIKALRGVYSQEDQLAKGSISPCAELMIRDVLQRYSDGER